MLVLRFVFFDVMCAWPSLTHSVMLFILGSVSVCDRGGLDAYGCFYHCFSALRD